MKFDEKCTSVRAEVTTAEARVVFRVGRIPGHRLSWLTYQNGLMTAAVRSRAQVQRMAHNLGIPFEDLQFEEGVLDEMPDEQQDPARNKP